jgi:hypothetical protein
MSRKASQTSRLAFWMSSQLPDLFAFPNCLCASHRAHAAMFMGGGAEQESCLRVRLPVPPSRIDFYTGELLEGVGGSTMNLHPGGVRRVNNVTRLAGGIRAWAVAVPEELARNEVVTAFSLRH